MAIVGSIFAMIGRFAGRILNTSLGWATLLLFGKVEGRRQSILLVIALASLLWVLVLIGVVLPDAGTFLLAFVPVPDWIDDNVVRLVMLGLAALIPLLIGLAATFVVEAGNRPKGLALPTAILRGYPFTLVLALSIVLLAAVSFVRKLRSMSKRWSDAHVPVVVKPGGYEQVFADLERVIDRAGLDVHPQPAPGVLTIPPKILKKAAGDTFGGLVPDRLMMLVGRELEVLVYPADVAISGSKNAMARARAAIAAELTHSPAYMTTSAESERVEDAILAVATAAEGADGSTAVELRRRLKSLDGEISKLAVPFDEWETVYRQRLQVERDLLAKRLADAPAIAPANEPPRGSLAGRLIAGAGLALIALDAGLLLVDRVTKSRR
jgi:hypothetical protein